MKRRTFNLLGSVSTLATMGLPRLAEAQASDFAQLSQTTLTPLGSERAGNADGSIPAWTGGYTTIPAGWTTSQSMPDFFAEDAPVVVVDANNMEQYKDRLSEGVMTLMTKYGFSIKVYPTHRTASAPQWVYDNIKANATRATVEPGGARLGFSNAYGGIPFPVPDQSNPETAGAQIIWNHNCRWQGYQVHVTSYDWVVQNGSAPVITSGVHNEFRFDYYDPNSTLENFTGYVYEGYISDFAPATAIGTNLLVKSPTNPYRQPVIAWQTLAGQGRVRKTPEVQYDTPLNYANGLVNYDEVYCFNGALNEYDWKLVEKKELYIPYNNNKNQLVTTAVAAGPKFLNPDVIRFELHRVWVVDAVLHPGERNVIARRRFYVDEDTWTIALADVWDAQGNFWRTSMNFNCIRPDVPGTIRVQSIAYNIQSNAYVNMDGCFADPGLSAPLNFSTPIPDDQLNPTQMAAESSY